CLVAAGKATANLISAQVAALTEGVVKAMFVTKLKSVLTVALVVGLVLGSIGVGIGVTTNSTAVAQEKSPDKPPAKDDKLPDADALRRAEADVKQAEAIVEVATAQLEEAQANYQLRKKALEKLQEKIKGNKPKQDPAKTDRERMVGN